MTATVTLRVDGEGHLAGRPFPAWLMVSAKYHFAGIPLLKPQMSFSPGHGWRCPVT